MTAPTGTPQPHRRRRRDLDGTPAAVLGMLMMVKSGRVDPDMAAIACQTSRQTILQAIHRLRSQGLIIETHPTPPGPSRVQWYRLDDFSRPKAWTLLSWWSDPDPEVWARYTKQMPQEENIHGANGQPADPAQQFAHTRQRHRQPDIDAAHDAAINENWTHW